MKGRNRIKKQINWEGEGSGYNVNKQNEINENLIKNE